MTFKFDRFKSAMDNEWRIFKDSPKIKFWTLDVYEIGRNYFTNNAIYGLTRKALQWYIEDEEDLLKAIEQLKIDYSDIRLDEYPTIADQGFEYKSNLAGFAACQTYTYDFLIVPVLELSGKDAEIICSAIALIS